MRKNRKAQSEGRAQESAYYVCAGVQPDGTLQEIGGEGRTWPDEEAFRKMAGARGLSLVRWRPAPVPAPEPEAQTEASVSGMETVRPEPARAPRAKAKRRASRVLLGQGPLGNAFFGAGVIMPDGTVLEFCGKGRTWPSVEAFHADRAGREATLILHFDADADKGFKQLEA